jgi:hypothetical protein
MTGIRSKESCVMERHETLQAMSELKLFGMRASKSVFLAIREPAMVLVARLPEQGWIRRIANAK